VRAARAARAGTRRSARGDETPYPRAVAVLEFFVRRLLITAITLVLISLIVFIGLRLIPGDPARTMAGQDADLAGLEAIRERYGLNDPIYVQYVRWVGLALQGDLGESIRTRVPVGATVLQKLPITIQLAGYSLLVALVIAIPSGVLSALHRNSLTDYVVNAISLSGLSIPNFWFGIMLILLFSVRLGWLPASGHVPFLQSPLGNLQHFLMPAFVLGTALSAVLMRQTRNSMIEVLSADYIRTAYSKGLARRTVVIRHALRNGLIPVVTILGLQLGTLISGAVITEQIFVVPGFGRLIVEAVFTRDYPLVQGVILVTASAYVGINLLVDLSYSLLNPRIRVRGGAGEG
jgi:peptide/nickel transport system permease protein